MFLISWGNVKSKMTLGPIQVYVCGMRNKDTDLLKDLKVNVQNNSGNKEQREAI